MCNGIDVAALAAAADSISAAPAHIRVACEWQGSAACLVRIEHPGADAEHDVGLRPRLEVSTSFGSGLTGRAEEPSPPELLLGAVGSSLVTSYVYQATMSGIRIDSLDVTVEADFDASGFLSKSPPDHSISGIRFTWQIMGAAPDDQLDALAESVARSSPVLRALTEPTQAVARG